MLNLLLLLLLTFTPLAQIKPTNIPEAPKDKALLVFFRLEEAQAMAGRRPKVQLGGNEIMKMPEEVWVAFAVTPGVQQVFMRQKQSQFEFTAEAGKTYYVHISQIPTGYFFRQSVSLANEEQAKAWIRNLKPISDSDIHKNARSLRIQ